MTDPIAIETTGLVKRYGQFQALAGLDLAAPKGSIFGLLGRNGAGKSTLIKILLGMVHPTSGEARVFGLSADQPRDSLEIRRRTGFVADEHALYPRMTVAETIAFTASFYPAWRADLAQHYLARFDLAPERRVRALSRGMRAKLALLLALCRGAELLILDEPTVGLDPQVKEEVLQAIVAHSGQEGMTVFFSTHHIDEVEQIADHLAILDAGKALESGSLDALRERYRQIQLVFEGEAPAVTFVSPGVGAIRRQGRVLTAVASQGATEAMREAAAFGAVTAEALPMSLKDIFLHRTGGEA